VKDVTFNPEELDMYNLIFLNLIVDPAKMGEQYGWEMNTWVKRAYEKGQMYRGNYPSLLFNITHEVGRDEMTDPMDGIIRQIHTSPALPEDMRLPNGRVFQVGSYIVNPDGEPW
jgi:hypothetical protein